MKKFLRYLLVAIIPFLAMSCNKPGGGNGEGYFTLNRADIIGCWKVIQAKFDEGATMTEWPNEDTYVIFLENGQYHTEGYFGTKDGSFSIYGNLVTAKVDNAPYIVYQVAGIQEDKATIIATLQSNQMKIWMVCQRYQGEDKYLEETPVATVSDDNIFNTEHEIVTYLSAQYATLLELAKLKLSIEEKIVSGDLSMLTPANSDIKSLWTGFYKVLRTNNSAIKILEKKDTQIADKHLPHFCALRAFIAYNLATLWGEVPFYKNVPNSADDITFYSAATILGEALQDLQSGVSWDLGNVTPYVYLNPTAAQVLRGEILLAKGDKQAAKECLNVNWNDQIFQLGDMVFCLWDASKNEQVLVYSKDRIIRLQKEADSQIAEARQAWADDSNAYGHWQFLKRVGDSQILLPIPAPESWLLSSSAKTE